MKRPAEPDRTLEVVIGLAALGLSTAAVLLDAYALAILALVAGAVGFGILLGSRSMRRR